MSKEITMGDVTDYIIEKTDREDWSKIREAMETRRGILDLKNKSNFKIGDTVKFYSKKDGWTEGKLTSLRKTRCTVIPEGQHRGWTVPISWLEKVE